MSRFNLGLFLLILFGGIQYPSYTFADDQQRLEALRQSIAEQEKKLAEQQKQRQQLSQELKKQETAIANLLASIEKSQKSLSTLSIEIQTLNKQISTLEIKFNHQKDTLSKQLENAFRLGKSTGMELVFNGTESERNERIIAYYGYLNKERQEQIREIKTTHAELQTNKQTLENKLLTQQALQEKQKQEQLVLEKNRSERQKTIKTLDSSMQVGQQKLGELRQNEAALQAQINDAERRSRAVAEQESRQAEHIKTKQQQNNYQPTTDEKSLIARVSGIGKPANKLNWPISGDVLHRFGESQQGELRWKGLVISANEGTQVKAIADGKVILASWLQGYGFVVVIDHGNGDMSLYGYNQRVLVGVSDNIKAGQAIALVGTSGGQGKSALYFEIRRDGRALDPQVWLKK